MGAEGADLQRLDRQLEVVARRRRAREVQHPVEGTVEWDVRADILLDESESGHGAERRDVLRLPRHEIVHAEHLAVLAEEKAREVGADETRASGDQDPHRPALSAQAGRTGRRPME